MTLELQREIHSLMEKFRDHPSNSNKYYNDLLALIEIEIDKAFAQGIDAVDNKSGLDE